MNLKGDFWGAVIGSVIVVGVPALVWGGSITSKVETLAKQQDETRKEIRDDLKEIRQMLNQALENKGKKAN